MNAAAPQPSLVLRASEVCVIANTQVSHVLPRLLKLTCCCRVRVQDLTVAPLVASVDYVDGALNQAQVGVTPVGFG